METAVKERRKRTFWNDASEAYFVDLWEQQLDQLLSEKKNTHVYQEMSANLAKHGIELSVPDIKYKISNLTAKYRYMNAKREATKRTNMEKLCFIYFQKMQRRVSVNR